MVLMDYRWLYFIITDIEENNDVKIAQWQLNSSEEFIGIIQGKYVNYDNVEMENDFMELLYPHLDKEFEDLELSVEF